MWRYFQNEVPGGSRLNFPMDKGRPANLHFDSYSTRIGHRLDHFVSLTKWNLSPHYEDLHLLLKGPRQPVPLSPYKYSLSALILKALDFVSLDSPPFGGQRDVCSKGPANFTVTAATLHRSSAEEMQGIFQNRHRNLTESVNSGLLYSFLFFHR